MLPSACELRAVIRELLNEPAQASEMSERAKIVLANHENAVEKTIELLHLNASVRVRNV